MSAALVAVLLASLGTYTVRAGSIRLFSRRPLPADVTRMFRLSALAVMASLVVTNLPSGSGPAGLGAASSAGVLAATLASRRTRHIPLIMTAGIAAYALIDLVIA